LNRRVTAAILCGGRGERLRPLTDFFQKTMVPIGPSKRPLLERVVRLLAFHGIKEIGMLTSYRTEEISGYFGDGSKFGVHVTYSRDPDNRQGSLNAIANAVNNGSVPECDVLLVYYGDVLSDLTLASSSEFTRATKRMPRLSFQKGIRFQWELRT
jgi:mannose-1-phosphate guanylyltransferase